MVSANRGTNRNRFTPRRNLCPWGRSVVQPPVRQGGNITEELNGAKVNPERNAVVGLCTCNASRNGKAETGMVKEGRRGNRSGGIEL